MVEHIRLRLVDEINALNQTKIIPEIAEQIGMGISWVGMFKTHRRCVKDFPMDTFFKLTDGLKINREELVKGVDDILANKVNQALSGQHRQLFHRFLELLSSGDENQIELLENLIGTLYRQTDEPDLPGNQRAKF